MHVIVNLCRLTLGVHFDTYMPLPQYWHPRGAATWNLGSEWLGCRHHHVGWSRHFRFEWKWQRAGRPEQFRFEFCTSRHGRGESRRNTAATHHARHPSKPTSSRCCPPRLPYDTSLRRLGSETILRPIHASVVCVSHFCNSMLLVNTCMEMQQILHVCTTTQSLTRDHTHTRVHVCLFV